MHRVVITREDDLDGSRADETIRFGIDGADYEIDLSQANATRLREAVSGYVDHARRIDARRSKPARPAGSGDGFQSEQGIAADTARQIRGWALANGYEVADRGRMSDIVTQAYFQAQHERLAEDPTARSAQTSSW